MEISIVEATRDDAAEILEVQAAAYQSEAELYSDWTIPPLTQTLPHLEAEFLDKTFLKALQGGRIVGSVRASLAGGTCAINRLIVRPDCQGKGIGTRLLARIEALFPSAKRFELFTGTESKANIRLYERLGYRPFREEPLSPKVTIVFMEKRR
jgi:GNAT superfamily N-acetyltransferase